MSICRKHDMKLKYKTDNKNGRQTERITLLKTHREHQYNAVQGRTTHTRTYKQF